MFQLARLKLTAWYLLIIMLISVTFSLVIFQGFSKEIERFERVQRLRIEHRLSERLPTRLPAANPELLEETKMRVLLILIAINSGILVISGGLGYLLAGRTLKPIKEMVEEQNRFITDSSHELRTPLTSLKSAMEVSLRDKHLSLKNAKILISENITEVNKLQSLSDELLKLAQFQNVSTPLVLQKAALTELVKQAIRRVEPMAKHKNIVIKDQATGGEIEADINGLIDVLVILLDNAIKYSADHKVIRVSSCSINGFIDISVTDQGVGIDSKDLPHIFDRFYRADAARSKTEADGYGLGLSIAKKIVDIHHGSLTVKSKLNKGSIFTVRLPVRQANDLIKPIFFS